MTDFLSILKNTFDILIINLKKDVMCAEKTIAWHRRKGQYKFY